MEFSVTATGHEHVTATHASTWEVTTDDYLSGRLLDGDFAPGRVDACR